MKDKILLGLLIVIVAGGTVAGILDFFVWAQPKPDVYSFGLGLTLGCAFTAFTPVIYLMLKYVFNGILLYLPILNLFVILRAIVTFFLWMMIAGAMILIQYEKGAIGVIISALIVVAHIAFRIYLIKNPGKLAL
jgi:hypothetical protein